MLIQVTYQSQLDAANKASEFTQTAFFEGEGLPEKPTVVNKLKEMSVDFAEDTVVIAAYIDEDADTLRSNGFSVTEL